MTLAQGWAALVLAGALWPLAGTALLARLPGGAWAMRRRRARRHRLRELAEGALRRFGLTALVALLAIGRPDALFSFPPTFLALARRWGLAGTVDASLLGALAGGVALGLLVGAGAAALWAWRGWRVRRPFGDFAGLEAGRPGDRGWGVVLSLVAGVTEEAYFRVALPLLAAAAGLGAAAGFVGAGLLFGLAHRWQGWRGVGATTVAGAGFAALYLASGSLALAIAAHALVDANTLVLRPWVRDAVRARVARRAGSRTRDLF